MAVGLTRLAENEKRENVWRRKSAREVFTIEFIDIPWVKERTLISHIPCPEKCTVTPTLPPQRMQNFSSMKSRCGYDLLVLTTAMTIDPTVRNVTNTIIPQTCHPYFGNEGYRLENVFVRRSPPPPPRPPPTNPSSKSSGSFCHRGVYAGSLTEMERYGGGLASGAGSAGGYEVEISWRRSGGWGGRVGDDKVLGMSSSRKEGWGPGRGEGACEDSGERSPVSGARRPRVEAESFSLIDTMIRRYVPR